MTVPRVGDLGWECILVHVYGDFKIATANTYQCMTTMSIFKKSD